MKGKTSLKVMLSLLIATTMVIPVTTIAATNNNFTDNNSNTNGGNSDSVQFINFDANPVPPTPMPNLPTGATVLMQENFTAFPGVFTVDNASGPANWTQGTVSSDGDGADAHYDSGNATYDEDYLNYSLDLTTVDTCYHVYMEFDYNATGEFNLTTGADTQTMAATTVWTHEKIDLTAYVGSTITVSFWYSGTDVNRLIDLDNVTIYSVPSTDIVINSVTLNGVTLTSGVNRLNTAPKTVEFNVSNNGEEDATDVDFHLQVYKEMPYNPETIKCWDMEDCNWQDWEAYDADGDGFSWYWTEQKANSPTHSWASHPDNMPSYEANSEDYLRMKDWYEIPATKDNKTVHAAWLNFSYWVKGEYDGTNAIDYGMVYIENATGLHAIGGPYYDSNDGWLYAEIDISAYIGQQIKIWFGWFADDAINYAGMYVDDVCIKVAYTSAQPLVDQGYKYTDLAAGETKTVSFPLTYEFEDGTYYIQIYSDYADCVLDNHGLGNGYADEVNYTVWIGDVCDAAVTGIVAPSEVVMPPDNGNEYTLIPINITVYNNGTLKEDIPVKAKAQQILTETYFKDDVESGDQGYSHDSFAGDDLWHITDYDFYTPYHAWAFMDGTNHYGAGLFNYWMAPQDDVDWAAVEHDPNFDIQYHMKWNINDADDIFVWAYVGNYVITYSSSGFNWTGKYPNTQGWTTVSTKDVMSLYLAGGMTLGEQAHDTLDWLNGLIGGSFVWPDDFHGFGILVRGAREAGLGNTAGLTTGAWAGVLIDDVNIFTEKPGATVWDETKTITLEPGATGQVNFTWNATEYGRYMIGGEITLACDMDSNNNEENTITHIYAHLFTDVNSTECDDNTYGLADHWAIETACMACPDNHFWWNHDDTTYADESNDILMINKVFNFTGVTEAYLNFTDKYWIEDGYDYGYVEVSNDSGDTWFILDEYTGNTSDTWVDESIHLVPGTTLMTSLYTPMSDFVMPTTFFTSTMMFRFRFYSDEATNEKGWYIDDVNLTINNGTWNTIFFDDMENGDANWIHMVMPYGCHWHAETSFGAPASTSSWYWNGEARNWLGTGALYTFGNGGAISFFDWDYTQVAGTSGSWNYWYGVGDERTYWAEGAVGDYQEAWLNYTVDFSSVPVGNTITMTLDAITQEAGTIFWLTATDGTTTINYQIVGAGGSTTYTFDLSPFAGSSAVTLAFHVNLTTVTGNEEFTLWYASITGTGPVIPVHQYYANVDEKLVFQFDLTHAYHAILTWDQNYSFADENDYGIVEIWTGSEWKALFLVKGSSPAWSQMSLDISDYVGGDEPTKIRFRFVSNDTGADYGWLIDNVSVWGYVDYENPAIAATLDPATPDGCNDWYKSPVTITLTANDNVKVSTIYYRIDGGAWVKYTAPFTINVDGSHTVDYYAVDEVGNPSATGTVSFKIDTTAPTVSITYPHEGYIYLMGRELFKNPLGGTIVIGKITFQADASDAMSGVYWVKFTVNDNTNFEYYDINSPYEAFWHNFDFLPHKYTLTVTAEDNACNDATAATLQFTHWL